ncbi:MAG: PEP-CTERM system TPR-repeat protein PrsT [Rhodoferax sp.]|uniref:XrtA/PEP-CTERM system TPR-repeat protein PrsT n=1 Tax=Rhodoferax sp. TaxID=50421 RepID=UPI00271579B4|nr:XrtA/PEP-CTERM system TPR-repeat protein PrsT [Rhodoferax sp.]MDO8451094.1 PEP-CTERM system TPR-repeat protein PrsT [Rhodoferax sp.]
MAMQTISKAFPRKICRFRNAIIVTAMASFMAGCGQDSLVAGNEYMKKGEYPSAVIEFKNAVQAKPDSIEARLALADALDRTYDTVGAEQHLRKVVSAGGDADSLLPRIALLMLDRNELGKIINEFKDRRLKSPEADSNLRAVVAVAYMGQKQNALAEEQLKNVSAKTASVMLARAQSLLGQDKKEQALAALDSSLAEPNSPWWVLRGLSRIHESNGNREQAFQFMTRAYEAVPWHRGVMGEYGEFLVGVGKLDQAIVIRDRLKKLAPAFYMTHYVDALVLSRQGRSEESLAAALKTLAVAPEHLPATLMVASAELQKGDVMMADRRLKKIAPKYPFSVPTLQLLAEAQLRLGKATDAADAIGRGLSVAPTNARLLSLRAESEVMRGAIKEATATLEQLSANDPANASYLLRLSELRARAGNKDGAKKLLDQATEAGKDNPAIRDRIIAISLGMGDVARVRQLADHAMKTRPHDPQSRLTLAATLGVEKDNAGAWRETLAALDIQPAFQPALTALTMMAREPKQREELVVRYEKAVQVKPSSAQTYLEYARLLQETQNDRASITALLEKGVRSLPTSTALREALAQEHFRAGKPDAALSVAQAGASANNASPDATALLATIYERVGETQLATETYRKLAANYPQRADWRLRLAELELGADRKKEATTILRSLIADRPFDPQPYVTLAHLTRPDNLQEAFSIARELGEKEPNKLTAMLLEGDLLALAGQSDAALKQFAKAAKAGAVPAALLRNVQILDRTKRSQAAEQELADALRKYPEDPTVMGFAAQRIRAQGNPGKAVELLQKIADKNPRNPVVLNDLAWAQIEAKQADALKNATRAAELAPGSPEVLDTLGMAQALAGKQTEAIATLRTAVNLAPKVPTTRFHLAELYIASGNRKEAGNLIQAMDRKKLGTKDQETLARLSSGLGG